MPSDTKYFTRLPPHSVTKETSLLCVRGVTMLATTKCILRSRIKHDFGKSEHGFSLIYNPRINYIQSAHSDPSIHMETNHVNKKIQCG